MTFEFGSDTPAWLQDMFSFAFPNDDDEENLLKIKSWMEIK